ncbi:Uncharacterised protein [uncultured archaeon]|nr:Uncharacterised protein [uncultured archaeon]
MVESISELSEGCTCGSKVFVFSRLEGSPSDTASPGSISLIPDLLSQKPAEMKSLPDAADSSGPNSSSASPALSSSGLSYLSALEPASKKKGPPVSVTPEESPLAPSPASAESPQPAPSGPSPGVESAPSSSSSDSAPSSSSSDSVSLPPLSSAPAPSDGDAPLHPSVASSPISEAEEPDSDEPYSEVWLSKGGSVEALDGQPLVHSVLTPPELGEEKAGVANIRQRQTGVYEIDVGRLRGEPLVIEDTEGVYYVRLPFVPLGEDAPGERTGTPKPKNKVE